MRIITFLKIFLAGVLFLALFFGGKRIISADCTYQCNHWSCYDVCQESSPWGCTQHCTCDGHATECTAPPGYYVCNDSDGVCPIGDPANNGNNENGQGGNNNACDTTSPTNITLTRTSANSATINWTPGSNGTEQRLYVGANESEVQSSCQGIASPACVLNLNLTASTNSISTGNVLVAGTTYYIRVVNYKNTGCSSSSPAVNYLSSCMLTPTSLTMQAGGPSSPISVSLESSTQIRNVAYSSDNSSVASVVADGNPPPTYPSTVTPGSSAGTATITGSAFWLDGSLACSGTATANVSLPGPWWQVRDSDIQTGGNLESGVPTGRFFGLLGTGLFPGVPAFGGSTNLTTGDASESPYGWLARSQTLSAKEYKYDFFARQIPEGTIINTINIIDQTNLNSGSVSSDGYRWYKYDGVSPANIGSAIDIGSNKVVLLIEAANLNISANVNLTTGFFGVFVNGGITIDPSVTSLEGIYLADGQVSTGTNGVNLDSALSVRGSVAAYGGVSLQRDLADDSIPAEYFEFAPDQILLFPSKISLRRINWKEVAP